jgi:phospholipid/cholesterol/gamma-HCH transport system substrate-binding protein
METRSNHVLVGAVVLALIAALAAFTIWLAGVGGGIRKEYDIFFRQSVQGIAKGAGVSFSGVPSGTVEKIELWKDNPEFVRVRISVNKEVPILVGTTASIQAVSFTGPSQIQLDGAVKGAPPIEELGPAGAPVIPTRTAGLGALLNNAPQLVERLSTLTERLTEVLSDENQKRLGSILANTDRLTGTLADSGPDIRATIQETRNSVKQAGLAIDSLAKLAGTTEQLLNSEGRPVIDDLRKTVAQAQKSMANLDAAIGDARPGLQALSNQTMPELNLLIRDLRVMSESLGSVANKLDQGGAASLIGAPSLPDYKPGKRP